MEEHIEAMIKVMHLIPIGSRVEIETPRGIYYGLLDETNDDNIALRFSVFEWGIVNGVWMEIPCEKKRYFSYSEIANPTVISSPFAVSQISKES